MTVYAGQLDAIAARLQAIFAGTSTKLVFGVTSPMIW